MGNPVSEIWPKGVTEQSLELKRQVLSKDLSSLGEVHQRAKRFFVFNAILIEMSGLGASGFKMATHDVFNLRHQQVQCACEIALVPEKQSPSDEALAPQRHNRRSIRQSNEVPLPKTML